MGAFSWKPLPQYFSLQFISQLLRCTHSFHKCSYIFNQAYVSLARNPLPCFLSDGFSCHRRKQAENYPRDISSFWLFIYWSFIRRTWRPFDADNWLRPSVGYLNWIHKHEQWFPFTVQYVVAYMRRRGPQGFRTRRQWFRCSFFTPPYSGVFIVIPSCGSLCFIQVPNSLRRLEIWWGRLYMIYWKCANTKNTYCDVCVHTMIK